MSPFELSALTAESLVLDSIVFDLTNLLSEMRSDDFAYEDVESSIRCLLRERYSRLDHIRDRILEDYYDENADYDLPF